MAITSQGWAFVSGSGDDVVAGYDTNIQFNSNGALSGSSNLTTDGSGSLSASVNISASAFYGDGANLTGLTASAVNVADGPVQAIQFRVDTPVSGEISGSAALMFLTASSTLSGTYAAFTAVTASTIVGGSPLVVSASATTVSGSFHVSGTFTVSGGASVDNAVFTAITASYVVGNSPLVISASNTIVTGSLTVTGSMIVTGSLIVSGSNTITNYGAFTSNEAGEDYDFRVESNSNQYMLFVSGGGDRVGIGTAAPDYTLDVAGDAGFDEYIYHNGDADTFIRLEPDEINIEVGGENMIFMVEGGGGDQADKVTINNALANVDFQVKGKSEANLIRTDAESGTVGIGPQAPLALLHVSSSGNEALFQVDGSGSGTILFVTGSGRVGIGESAPEAYLDIKNTVDDGETNRTMLRLHNYRSDDANHNDFGPISIDFEIEQLSGGAKSGIARIAAVQAPSGTDHTTPLGEKTSGLIFSTMNNNTLAEAMRINASGNVGIGTADPRSALTVIGDLSVCAGTASILHLSGCSPIEVHAPMSSSYEISASSITLPSGKSIVFDGSAKTFKIANNGNQLLIAATTAAFNGNISGSGATKLVGNAQFGATIAASGAISSVVGITGSSGKFSGLMSASHFVGNGAGLTNVPGGGGSVAGSDSQIQFNQNGAAAANAGLTYSGTGSVILSGSTDGFQDAQLEFGRNIGQIYSEYDDGYLFNVKAVDGEVDVSGSDGVFLMGPDVSVFTTDGLIVYSLSEAVKARITAAGAISGSSTAKIVGAAQFGATLAASGAISSVMGITGSAFKVDDTSANPATRNTAVIIQNHVEAIAATALHVQSDGGITGVSLDKNYTDTSAATVTGQQIDFDKTGTSTSNNTMYGINIDMDNTTATDGLNQMYGIYCTPTLTHAADAGTALVYGAVVTATGGTNGAGIATGARIGATGADLNYGVIIDCEDGGTDLRIESSADGGDYFQIQTTTAGASTITTVDDGGAAAHLTFNVDGDITLDPAGGTVAVDGNVSASVNISASAFYGDGANLTNVASTPSPAGSDTQIQFNQNGAVAANAGLAYSGTGSVTISGSDDGNPTSGFKFCDGHFRLGRQFDTDESEHIFSILNAAPSGIVQISASTGVILAGGDGMTRGVSIEGSNFVVQDLSENVRFWIQDADGYVVAYERLGVNVNTPLVSLDAHYTGSGNPTGLSNDTGGGEVVYFGTSSAALVAGGVYYLNTNGGWQSVDAATTGSGHNQLLGISLGTKATANGMLIKGFFDVNAFYSGSFIKGGPVYIQSSSVARVVTDGGYLSGAAPDATDSYVRIVGYNTDTANVIYFNPDATYVELA